MDCMVSPLPTSGSQRKYYRVKIGAGEVLMCQSADTEENRTFTRLARYLKESGVNVPEIYWVSPDEATYILEDLGREDLLGMILKNRERGNEKETWHIIVGTLRQLVKIQTLPQEEWQEKVQFPPFESDLIEADLRYFLIQMVDASGVSYDSCKLWEEFESLKRRLMAYPRELWGWMYRDFQSRNIMIKDGAPYFIDFQSARYGPGIYDLVSFAWQAKAAFSTEERRLIIEEYGVAWERRQRGAEDVIKREIHYWAIFRILQTLGAYGLRGLKEGKQHFIDSIPAALRNISLLLEGEEVKEEMPELTHIIEKLTQKYG